MAIVNFVWDALSDNVLKETDDADSTVTAYTNAPSQFGETLSQNQSVGDTYFHYDGLGCTRNLTAQNETVVRTNIYTGFGETVISTGLHSTRFGWNGAAGYYTDNETGDFYVRRRTYNPDTGRWRSRDPLRFVDGPNVYAYVRNQPIAIIDLTDTMYFRKDPLEFVDGMSLYRAYFVPSGVDPSGKIVVTADPNNTNLGKLACSATARQHFNFGFDGGAAPCNGIIVQKVTFKCKFRNCSKAECKKCKPIGKPTTKQLVYYEYKKVNKGDLVFVDPVQWSRPSTNTKGDWGSLTSKGVIKFFCFDADDDADQQKDVNEPKWKPQTFTNFSKTCGDISTGTWGASKNKPNWWTEKNTEKVGTREFSVEWFCCDNCQNNHLTASANPKP